MHKAIGLKRKKSKTVVQHLTTTFQQHGNLSDIGEFPDYQIVKLVELSIAIEDA